jgi:hypothetical protein
MVNAIENPDDIELLAYDVCALSLSLFKVYAFGLITHRCLSCGEVSAQWRHQVEKTNPKDWDYKLDII